MEKFPSFEWIVYSRFIWPLIENSFRGIFNSRWRFFDTGFQLDGEY